MYQFQRPIHLYWAIAGDEYIVSQIGRIRLATGGMSNAIMIVPPYPEKDAEFTGVSIAIHEDAYQFGSEGDGSGRYRYFLISVTCHDAAYSAYRGVVNRIIQRFPYKVKTITVQNSDSLGLPFKPRTDIYVCQFY